MSGKTVRNDRRCFCCGEHNEKGLKLVFSSPGEGQAEAGLTIPEYFTGWENLTHGGFISMLLDEAMAHACLSAGVSGGVTAELTVRFRAPLPVGTGVIVSGKVEELRSRIIMTVGEVKDREGTVYASGKARFIRT